MLIQSLAAIKSIARPLSAKQYQALVEVIPAGVNSPVRAFSGLNLTPLIVERGVADTLIDLDGHQFIDFCLSWGALIHGHAHPKIIEAVVQRLAWGSSFGCSTVIEESLARKVISFMPSIEKIRFVSSGTEATMSAVRLARGYTGRSRIIKFTGCYHGHADSFLTQAGSGVLGMNATATSAGVPNAHFYWTTSLPYNDSVAFDQFLNDPKMAQEIAAVIIEPVATNMGLVLPEPGFLEHIRLRTQEIGALLIFDEVVTGFRIAKGGAQGYFGITPDLTCIGKIIGGGFPAAAFGGKKEIMEFLAPIGPVYQAGTLSGNPIAMEAGYQALQLIEETPNFYELLESKANYLLQPIEEYIQTKGILASVHRLGSCFTIFFGRKSVTNMHEAMTCDQARFFDFFHYLFNRGVYISQGPYEICTLSSVHTLEHLDKTRELILEYLKL